MTYTTIGNIRGTCGHKHQSIRTAVKCMFADSDGCHRQGGYSDRKVVRSIKGVAIADHFGWTDAEDHELHRQMQAQC